MKLSGRLLVALVVGSVFFSTAPALAAARSVPQSILEALSRGEPQDLIVEFDSRAAIRRMEAMRATKASATSGREVQSFLAREFSLLKTSALAGLPARDYDTLREYSHLPMLFLRIRSRAFLLSLLERTEVVAVYPDEKMKKTLAESLPLIHQPQAAALGHRGAGATVVVLDTGVDFTRAAFGSCTAPGVPAGCKVAVSLDIADPDGINDDSELHGTNVSGIVVGVAPDSRIAALDVFNDDTANSSIVIEGINWAIANQAQYNIVAMNLSLGGETGFTAPCDTSAYTSAFALARSAGILAVVASGNLGLINQITAPACTPGAVSVGAVYDSDVGPVNWSDCSDTTTAADKVTCFSNSASFLTLLAPGAHINAAGVRQGGTSQASPHVAGAVAVLRASYPGEVHEQIITRLTSTGTPVTDARSGLVKPRLNLEAAATAASPPPPPPPTTCPTQTVTCPVTLAGNLASSDCTGGHLGSTFFTDAYQFSGIAGQTVRIDMSTTLPQPELDPYLILLSPTGAIAAQNDDIDLGVDVNSRIVFTLTATGTWTVEASTFAPGMVGEYSLSITGCAPPQPSVCIPGSTTLCLSGGRFKVQTTWRTPDGASGSGNAVALTADTGYFWFFNSANVEMVVKVLNACGFAQRVWVFSGGLTNVEVTMTVTDSDNGSVKTYMNPQGTAFLPIQDTQAFATCSSGAEAAPAALPIATPRISPRVEIRTIKPPGRAGNKAVSSAACTPGTNALCLSGGRFRVQTTWRTSDGRSGTGTAVSLSSDTGYFWFFESTNVEMVVKVLNACSFAQRIWVFAGGLTNVEVTMTVEDTVSGAIKTYTNPQGAAFLPIQDTQAFTTCP